MGRIIIIFRILLILFSFYGYLQFFRKKIALELAVGYIICGISSTMFLFGILNLLLEATWCIFAVGLFLAVRSFLRKDRIADLFTPGFIIFLIAAVFFLFLLYGSKFTDYDNFSHWALAPHILINNDRFPDASDAIFWFSSYPLGSASFIYYVSEITGMSSEWSQMYTQAMMMVGLILGFFALSRQLACNLVALAGCLMLLCSNVSFTDLLVDTLLPVAGLYGVCFCYYYKNSLKERLLMLIPCTVFLISIKNSGIFFALCVWLIAWYYTRHSGVSKKVQCLTVLFPLFMLLLWNKHVDQAFLHAFPSKHEMSISNYQNVLAGKNAEDLLAVFRLVSERTFTLSNPGIQILVVCLVIFLLWRFALHQPGKDLKEIFCIAALSYAGYQIGLLGMFLFSMPRSESLSLAGYFRYHETIMIYLGGLALLEVIHVITHTQGTVTVRTLSAGLSLFVLVGILWTLEPNFYAYQRQDLEGTERQAFDDLIEQYYIQQQASYLILVSEERNDYGYLYYLSNYLLWPESLSILPDDSLDDLELQDYDYIIVFEQTEKNMKFLSNAFPENQEPVINLGELVF